MTEKIVWLIGGSIMSKPMCTEIKRRGYKLLLTDGNENCTCREYADQFYPLDVYDVEANVYLVTTQLKDVDIVAVLTIGTDAGTTVSALNEYLGLPGIDYETARRVKDKSQMRQTLELPHPFYFIKSTLNPLGFFEPGLFPLVVKATDQAGSRGFAIANTNDELHAIVNQREGDVLIEQQLIGENVIPEWEEFGFDTSEAAFDFFVEDGEVIYANGALRLFWLDQTGIEAGHINPFEASPQIMDLAQYAAGQLGVTQGPFKIDVKKDRRYSWSLLECATRLSGGLDHMYTSPLATGRDITGVMLDVALGERVDRKKLVNKKGRWACAFAPRFQPGKIIDWVEDAVLDNRTEVYPLVSAGEEIKPLEVNQNRPLFVIDSGGSLREALLVTMIEAAKIRPIYQEG